jgi:hypothetical protein
MKVEQLESLLSSWDANANKRKKPKQIYCNPNGNQKKKHIKQFHISFLHCRHHVLAGQNPSGTSLSLARKQKLYQLASEHNMLIIEDDPYIELLLGENPVRVQSLFSMDTEGRVVRFDSFSKSKETGGVEWNGALLIFLFLFGFSSSFLFFLFWLSYLLWYANRLCHWTRSNCRKTADRSTGDVFARERSVAGGVACHSSAMG